MLEPLEGYTIAVTADRRAGEQAELLTRRGATVVQAAGIRTIAVSEEPATKEATRRLLRTPPDYVVANTAIGMRGWTTAAEAWGWHDRLVDTLRSSRVLARGPKAAGAAAAMGIDVEWLAPSEQLREVVAFLLTQPLEGRRVAFQQHGEDCAVTTAPLRAAGADVIEVPVYRSRFPDDPAPLHRLLRAVAERRIDAVTFTNARTVHNVFSLAARDGLPRLRAALDDGDIVVVAVGPVTAAALHDEGVHRVIAPPLGRLGTMVRVLTEAMGPRRLRLGNGVVVQGAAVAGPDHRAVLTEKERALLRALTAEPGVVFTRDRLLAAAWREGEGDERALEAAVHRLRRKLGPGAGVLATVAKRGYRLDLTVPAAAG